ncbi:MAG: hybrid sensor histidine kinase/response regulator [Magnetococcus sp. DMHC-1]
MADNNDTQRILIVDDVPGNIEILAAFLADEYAISIATDGIRALEIAESVSVDLILLDIVMPDMDGFTVCTHLKANENTRDIPVIFVTSKNDATDETYALGLGAMDFISKPVVPAVVKARVKTHLGLINAKKTLEKQKKILESQNQELRKAEELREEVDRIMRHDLKSPLYAMLGFVDYLKYELILSDSHNKLFHIIQDSGNILLNMINLSLDLFKMERGTYSFDPIPVDIVSLVNKICVSGNDLIQFENLRFELFVDDQPTSSKEEFLILGEETLCYSMLSNLIRNAIEASPSGEVITVRMERGSLNKIKIHNFGSIPHDIRNNFFKKYSTSGKKGGTGLGAYSAKLMAETLGGKISFTTSDTDGTTLCVELPPVIIK